MCLMDGGNKEDMRVVVGGENIIRVYTMKIFSIKINKNIKNKLCMKFSKNKILLKIAIKRKGNL